ncbi:hypothetical protein SAY87_001846 [Trapa incisa]|uniref:Vesicle-associated membrane protein 714 n=1 Tax=Trapa incisa TaxID=236973 RepID=A0AAN7JUX0_9MYRT|nr:hypothetical protein SAY87_001846 [Trapa incisa]
MAILYAVVARGTVVLAEFSAATGNTGAVARRILERLPSEANSRLCFSQDRYIFHILKSDGLTFLCMANDTFGRRIAFSYLEDIHMRFLKNYGRVAPHAPAYAMNDEFSRVLHQQMEFFSSNPSADTLNRVRGEVEEVRTIMVENIEKILERGDRIELLVDKTSTLQDGAFHFKKQSKRLHRALWMKNVKLLKKSLTICLRRWFWFIEDVNIGRPCRQTGKLFQSDVSNLRYHINQHQSLTLIGIADWSDCSAAVHYTCGCLWRHHPTEMQILSLTSNEPWLLVSTS